MDILKSELCTDTPTIINLTHVKYTRTDALSLWHQHWEPRWTFMDPCKPEVRPGAREESASPVWLPAPAMNARDTTKVIYGGLTLYVDRHYIGSVTATTHQEKGIITLESNPSNPCIIACWFYSYGTIVQEFLNRIQYLSRCDWVIKGV